LTHRRNRHFWQDIHRGFCRERGITTDNFLRLPFEPCLKIIMDDIRPQLAAEPTRFIDQLRSTIRRRGLSYATEKTYVHWALRFIRFHNKRHPERMGSPEVEQFLDDLAEQRRCAVATQRLALNALVFLYNKHLRVSLGELRFQRARRQRRMPTVFTHAEATTIIRCLSGVYRIIGALMYGSGLRVNEVLRLRIKDLDFGSKQVTVRDGKGGNERFTQRHHHKRGSTCAGTALCTTIREKSSCCWLKRRLDSTGDTLDGSHRTAVSARLYQSSPISRNAA